MNPEANPATDAQMIVGYSKEYVEKILSDLEMQKNKVKKLEETLKKIRVLLNQDLSDKDFKKQTFNEKLSESINVLGLERRPHNCLLAQEILLVGDLVNKTEAELLKIKHLGHKSLNNIKKFLALNNLALGFNCDDWIRPEVVK